jgi:PAS domain S-box-containing protein
MTEEERNLNPDKSSEGIGLESYLRRIERRQWWLWSAAILVTLLLTLGIVSFVVPMLRLAGVSTEYVQLHDAVRGLVGLVLIFDVYIIYQQLQIYRFRRRLLQREELFRLITENAADLIAVVDAKGNRLYNSPSYQKVLGYTAEELRTSSPFEQIYPDDRAEVEEALKEAVLGGAGRRIEYRMRHKDGSWRYMESTASAILTTEGKVENLVIVNRDVTARRQLEEQFHQAQKMEAVGRLSGGIAHDFNNLLGVITGYSEVMQEQLEPNHPLRPCVDEVLGAARRAAELTRQLLVFSRQQVLEPRVLNLNVVVSEMEKMLCRLIGEDIELTTKLDPELGRVRADVSQIEQTVMNLAVNARDAMARGGKLTIGTSNKEIDSAFARSHSFPVRQGPYVLLSVTDTGVGMDTVTQSRIFEPFFTTKDKGKGTGLGLSTVYGVVKQSGGYIDVATEPGHGTTFTVYLPRVEEAVEPEPSAPSASTTIHANETILLVEDEAALRKLTRNLMELCGYTVLEAKSVHDAAEIGRQHESIIHLLLTDVVMPGMNGPELAKQVAATRPEIKILYMSGYTGQTFSGAGALEKGSHFLQKPFTRGALAQKIRETLDDRGASAQSAGRL